MHTDNWIDLVKRYVENGSLFIQTEVQVGKRQLRALARRDPDIDTIWQVGHLQHRGGISGEGIYEEAYRATRSVYHSMGL